MHERNGFAQSHGQANIEELFFSLLTIRWQIRLGLVRESQSAEKHCSVRNGKVGCTLGRWVTWYWSLTHYKVRVQVDPPRTVE